MLTPKSATGRIATPARTFTLGSETGGNLTTGIRPMAFVSGVILSVASFEVVVLGVAAVGFAFALVAAAAMA